MSRDELEKEKVRLAKKREYWRRGLINAAKNAGINGGVSPALNGSGVVLLGLGSNNSSSALAPLGITVPASALHQQQ